MPETKNKELYPDGLFERACPFPNVHRYIVAIIDPALKKRITMTAYLNTYVGIVINRNETENAIREELRERIVKEYIDKMCQGVLKDVLKDKWYSIWGYLEMRGCTIEIEEKTPEVIK